MDLSHIPPLLLSEADPIVHGHAIKLDSVEQQVFPTFTLNNHESFSAETNVVGYSDHTEVNSQRKMHQLSSSMYDSEAETQEISTEELPNGLYSSCCLKRCQCCYAVVRKDANKPLHADAFAFGSNSTLPGVVDIDELCTKSAHRKQTFAHRFNRFWNANLQLSHSKQNEKFIEYTHHFLVQIRKFIRKLRKACSEEHTFVEKLEKSSTKDANTASREQNKFASRNRLYNVNDSNYFDSEEEYQGENEPSYIRPVKLGKVYAELQMHFKSWNDIMEKWQASRQDMDPEMLQFLTTTYKRINNHQAEMLILTEHLITARLNSFACCVTSFSNSDDSEKEWDYLFGPGSLKRLCKLIEVYNKLLRQQKEVNVPRSSVSLQDTLSMSSSTFRPATKKPSLPLFDVSRILNILAVPVQNKLADSLLSVLTLVQQAKQDNVHRFEQQVLGRSSNFSQFDWANAYKFEIDEDHVLTHIAGYEINNLFETQLSSENFSAIKQLLYTQGSFIVWFMNCLAANTSLLRSNIQSKSARSIVSSQTFGDDVSAVSSDDEASSVSSSLVISQFSGATNTLKRRKTVLWRDSWDQEAVKSSSKSYIASIITEAPAQCLLSRVLNPHLEPDKVETFGRKLLQILGEAKCFRPRFTSDHQTLILDAYILNMLTVKLLPDDLLESLHHATQTFIIEKALEKWDISLCLALGTSINDKCGSLPVEGQPSVTKTALTYIKAIRTLMFIMDKYSKREDVAQSALPRLQTTLDSFHRWCYSKIQQFVTSWKLRELMQVTLGDLGHVTQIALSALPLIEKCHNHIESKRMASPGTLQQATKHLQNIDAIITDMQSLSGYCIKSYTKKCLNLAKASIEASFPSNKLWKQKTLTDHTSANSYMVETVRGILVPICAAVSSLKPRSQLAAVPPALSSILDAVIRIILQRNVRFSMQGTMQLQSDFDYVIDYVCSDEAQLCFEVQRAVPQLGPVNRALWVVNTLQRTDVATPSRHTRTGYEKSRRRAHARSTSPPEDFSDGQDDNDWTLKETEFLALRAHVSSKKDQSRCFPLPCYKDTVK